MVYYCFYVFKIRHCRLPGLAVALTLHYSSSTVPVTAKQEISDQIEKPLTKPEISDVAAFVSSLLLSSDPNTRSWFAQFIRMGQKVSFALCMISMLHVKIYHAYFFFEKFVIKVKKTTKFGLQMDHHLSMISQVTAICAACNFQLYRLSSVRRFLTVDATKKAVQALIASRLDYCNSLLLNLPTSQIARLQRIQNKAARLVTRTSMRELITLVLKELHWLPIDRRVVYKVLVITYKALHGLAPVYLAELLAP